MLPQHWHHVDSEVQVGKLSFVLLGYPAPYSFLRCIGIRRFPLGTEMAALEIANQWQKKIRPRVNTLLYILAMRS